MNPVKNDPSRFFKTIERVGIRLDRFYGRLVRLFGYPDYDRLKEAEESALRKNKWRKWGVHASYYYRNEDSLNLTGNVTVICIQARSWDKIRRAGL